MNYQTQQMMNYLKQMLVLMTTGTTMRAPVAMLQASIPVHPTPEILLRDLKSALARVKPPPCHIVRKYNRAVYAAPDLDKAPSLRKVISILTSEYGLTTPRVIYWGTPEASVIPERLMREVEAIRKMAFFRGVTILPGPSFTPIEKAKIGMGIIMYDWDNIYAWSDGSAYEACLCFAHEAAHYILYYKARALFDACEAMSAKQPSFASQFRPMVEEAVWDFVSMMEDCLPGKKER